MTDTRPDLTVTSGVSQRTGEGFLSFSWGELHGQLDPAEARTFALGVIEAADAAEFDAALTKWARATGFEEDAINGLLGAIRIGRDLPPMWSGRAKT